MKKNGQKIFRGGVPTFPDAKTLFKYYENLQPGDEIAFEDLEAILGLHRKSTRFKTIVTVWRKMLMNTRGIVLAPLQGMGLVVADDTTKLVLGHQRVKTAGTYLKHGADIVRRIEHPEALPEEDRRSIDHIVNIAVSLEGFRRVKAAKKYTPMFSVTVQGPDSDDE